MEKLCRNCPPNYVGISTCRILLYIRRLSDELSIQSSKREVLYISKFGEDFVDPWIDAVLMKAKKRFKADLMIKFKSSSNSFKDREIWLVKDLEAIGAKLIIDVTPMICKREATLTTQDEVLGSLKTGAVETEWRKPQSWGSKDKESKGIGESDVVV
jgi:hypothetical protein